MHKFFFGLAIFLLSSVMGCAPVDVLNALVPNDTYHLKTDIAYGDLPRQKLDIYTPKGEAKGTLVFIHGGSWQIGDKGEYRFVGEAFARRGFVTIIPNYRLAPEVAFPSFIDDSAAAVNWALGHQKQHGPLYVAGHSAGAYNAVMLFALGKVNPAAVKGVIGLAGPYDFLPLTDPKLHPIFAPAKPLETSQPIHYAAQKFPPLLLITGTEDTDVFPKNTRNFTKALAAHGTKAEAVYLPDIDHIDIITALAHPLENAAVTAPIERFLKQ